jgi:uncharacterized protein
MIDAGAHGVPSWIDLSTPDVAAATRFYRELLGWTIAHHVSPMGDYYIGEVAGFEVGGMMAAPPEWEDMPAVWTVLFTVDDVDATVTAITGAGGTIHEPPFDLPNARLAIVADPTGAMFGVISGPEITGAWLRSDPGTVCWVELLTRDPAAAEAFYATVFGWKAETKDYGSVRYTTYALDGEDVAGAMMMPAEVPAEVPAVWAVSFNVPDCAEAERRAIELGATVARPTSPTGEGRFAVLEDPTGATFQIMDHVAPA